MRLIDADALKESFYKKISKEELQYTQPFIVASLTLLEKFINHAPTIEAKPVVHAHWQKYDDSEFCYCSHCGKPAAEDNDVSWHGYCPVCGALMDEVISK